MSFWASSKILRFSAFPSDILSLVELPCSLRNARPFESLALSLSLFVSLSLCGYRGTVVSPFLQLRLCPPEDFQYPRNTRLSLKFRYCEQRALSTVAVPQICTGQTKPASSWRNHCDILETRVLSIMRASATNKIVDWPVFTEKILVKFNEVDFANYFSFSLISTKLINLIFDDRNDVKHWGKKHRTGISLITTDIIIYSEFLEYSLHPLHKTQQ